VISVYYDDMIKSLVAGMKEAFGDARPHAEAQPSRALGFVWRHRDAYGLPRPVREDFSTRAICRFRYRKSAWPRNPLETAAKGAWSPLSPRCKPAPSTSPNKVWELLTRRSSYKRRPAFFFFSLGILYPVAIVSVSAEIGCPAEETAGWRLPVSDSIC